MIINFKKAYTFAEVVIVISILGIIAGFTIPIFVSNNNLNNTKYVNGLKKFYIDLYEATSKIKSNNGGTFIGSYNASSSASRNDNLKNLYARFFKYTQSCDQSTSQTKCWPSNYYQLSGSANGINLASWSMAQLNDGMLVAFLSYNNTLSDGLIACNDSTVLSPPYGVGAPQIGCGEILVDVNGFDKPNRFGKDIFKFYIAQNNIVPEGEEGTPLSSRTCPDNDDSQDGLECTATVLRDSRMLY